jgi:DNA polymerase-3 subunit epsilon
MCEDYDTGETLYPERNIYINPEDGFDDVCVRIHGISADKVKNEPAFPNVWKEIECYFTNAIVIGHNVAGADLDALVKALKRYNIDIPELYYICTLELAKKYVPRYSVQNFSMSSLCRYFEIDIDSEHDAFDDACANSDLFRALVDIYDINIDSCVQKYIPHESEVFTSYAVNPVIRKAISEFYGMIRGFSIDNEINVAETACIIRWKKDNHQYSNFKEFSSIISVIDSIAADGKITIDEIIELQSTVKSFLDVVSTAPVTLATQILDGIMKGITVDGEISENECKSLRQWLYDNIYLSGHFPFDKILRTVEDVLADSRVTDEESAYLSSIINELLNPVDVLKTQINTVDGKHICISGNFAYGQKSDVEKYIIERGGFIDSSVKKNTDIILIGDCECQAYSNGTYGTKVKKAMEYNEKGCNIQIMKESDFFSRV